MSEPFIGQISMFAGNFAPRGWAFCNGQLLSVSQHTALFSILGTTYGGNGQTTFALPNLQGRVPVHIGQSLDTSNYMLGEAGGVESVTLTINQMPAHSHQVTKAGSGSLQVAGTGSNASTTPSATNNILGASAAGGSPAAAIWSDELNDPVSLANPINANFIVQLAGGSQPFSIRNPYLGMNFIIALEGLYPTRN
ncbi:tail fiber protein [Shewanella seohaensis]|uniref:phage tail protein n=1 Tax=Shewanella seohaensis TaxID=755175 RepID=UPI00200E1FC1|nr:tail fiber protein [Shewanella seohaensis]MCL1122218.1 tail fiber protein [Shewanella seohaensis]UXM82398.1 tail fiber protein [Shewanella seohaensis]